MARRGLRCAAAFVILSLFTTLSVAAGISATGASAADDDGGGATVAHGGGRGRHKPRPPPPGLTRLALNQLIVPPRPAGRPHQPTCLSTATVDAWLTAAIQQDYAPLLVGGGDVTASSRTTTQTLSQRDLLDSVCNHTSLVQYRGASALQDQLVAAVNAGKLCDALPTYCAAAFNASAGYTLASASAVRDALPAVPEQFNCVAANFSQRLDHFDAANTQRFNQLYYVCDATWPKGSKREQAARGNVIVFLGNETPLSKPQQPIIFENARRLNALVVLVEHRYYGKSMPFTPATAGGALATWQYKWLTVQNAIEDTTAVLAAVRAARRVPAATPAIVIGGSYGGVLATYHRVVKPSVFAAAVSSSACARPRARARLPLRRGRQLNFVFGSNTWAATSERFHIVLGDSMRTFGGDRCVAVARAGLDAVMAATKTPAGRQSIVDTFSVCAASAPRVLKDEAGGLSAFMEIYGRFHGWVQLNNQPSLLGQVAALCELLIDRADAPGGSPMAAVADARYFFESGGAPDWCMSVSPYTLITDALPSWSYQCCTQGTIFSGIPSDGSPRSIAPPYTATPAALAADCSLMFGPGVPPLAPAPFMLGVAGLVNATGGLVLTNGDLDPWAGGSWGPYPPDAAGGGGAASPSSYKTITYPRASHVSDTHTTNWDNPLPPEQGLYTFLRTLAITSAARLARG
ncbi:hypothetical protein HT031_005684 [Scenedesmus sp. PABB004]|nr:hypothetical protein HT031_005684 [Scenedesmus sp. PABB004]